MKIIICRVSKFMSIYPKTIAKKKVNDNSYRLVQFSDKFVIYKDSMIRGKEADFGEEVKQFSDEIKAMKFFNNIGK